MPLTLNLNHVDIQDSNSKETKMLVKKKGAIC